jgi:hypothetical protein
VISSTGYSTALVTILLHSIMSASEICIGGRFLQAWRKVSTPPTAYAKPTLLIISCSLLRATCALITLKFALALLRIDIVVMQ